MAYVDYNYYTNTYHGESVTEADFPTLSERATDVINSVTGYKISDIDILTDFDKEQVKKATCSQIEYIDLMGSTVSGELSSASLGKFSYYSGGNGQASKVLINPSVYDYLAPTGLLYRGL